MCLKFGMNALPGQLLQLLTVNQVASSWTLVSLWAFLVFVVFFFFNIEEGQCQFKLEKKKSL